MDIVDKLKSQIGDDPQFIFDYEALFKQAAAEIERLRARTTWYRIDDPDNPPPKDGTVVRLFYPDWVEMDTRIGNASPGQVEGFYAGSAEHGRWVIPHRMDTRDPIPSHWRPLPTPPEDRT